MLIIGHRGAAGLARENSIEALRAGIKAGADILEIDVRLTKDKVPVLVHDFHTLRTHGDTSIISHLTLEQLKEKFHGQPIVRLEEALDLFFGKVLLNIEAKGRGTGAAIASLIRERYIKKLKDWDAFFISSFRGSELAAAREVSDECNLALLHSENPFIFIAYHRKLRLTAIGFHRLYINPLALAIAKKAKIFVYAYTVNRPLTAITLAQKGIDGVVTDYPDRIIRSLKKR